MRVRRGDDGVDGMERLAGSRRLGQHRIAEASLAMDGSGVGRRFESGVAEPGQTGMSARPASARTARVLRVAASRLTLPTTVDTPRMARRGSAQA